MLMICLTSNRYSSVLFWNYMDVSEKRGTPKSSILIGISIINRPFWGPPIFGNPHILPKPQPFQAFLAGKLTAPPKPKGNLLVSREKNRTDHRGSMIGTSQRCEALESMAIDSLGFFSMRVFPRIKVYNGKPY